MICGLDVQWLQDNSKNFYYSESDRKNSITLNFNGQLRSLSVASVC